MRGWLLCVVATAACGRVGFDPHAAVDAPASGIDGCTVGAWGNVTRLAALASPQEDWEPAVDPAGLVLVFGTGRDGGADLYVSTRATVADPFDPPVAIPSLDTTNQNEQGPAWSPDGARIYFTRFDPTLISSMKLASTYRGGTSFDPPVQADLPDCDQFELADDDLEMFCTESPADMEYNLVHALRSAVGNPWLLDGGVANLNDAEPEGWPSFDDAHQTLYYERSNGVASELAIATRTGRGQPFTAGTPVSDVAVPGGDDGDPEISRDGLTLWFASRRSGGDGANDLYQATRNCQ